MDLRFHHILMAGMLLLPWTGRADVMIYNNGAPDQFGTYYADSSSFYTLDASAFTLTAGSSTVSSATWWGGCSPEGTCPAGSFDIVFYADDGGMPGLAVASYSVGGADQTATGQEIGASIGTPFTEYEYTASFAPLALTPGTTYFFAVGDDTGEIDTWGQETADAFAPSGSHYQYGGGAWTPGDSTLAFELFGPSPVPEPASILLLGTVLLGLGSGLRRKWNR